MSDILGPPEQGVKMPPETAESGAPCTCHGADRPHPPHLPCDMDCQPDWHHSACAIYRRQPTQAVGAGRRTPPSKGGDS